MYRNSHTIAKMILKSVGKIARSIGSAMTFGISGRQWLASALTCAMMWTLFALPVSGFAITTANGSTGEFEPVNEKLPIWSEAWRDLSADIETRLTSWRPTNYLNNNSSSNDEKNLKKKKPDEKSLGKETTKLEPADTDSHADEIKLRSEAENIKTSEPPPHPVNIQSPPAPMVVMNQLPDDEQDSIYSYENNLGAPKGQVEMDSTNMAAALRIKHRVGTANFSFGLPLASLPGRGIDAGIGMTYNSRTWNKSCTTYDSGGNCTTDHYTYDVEQSWIAPGFSSGFGYLESSAELRNVNYDPPNNSWHTEITPQGFADPDGTRHQLSCISTASIPGAGSQVRCTVYGTTDGSNITFQAKNYIANSGNSTNPNTSTYSQASFVTTYPGGSKIWYSGGFGSGTKRRHYPLIMQDSNGNRIRIAYNPDQSGRIDYVTDTLNRQIKFYYENDTNGNPIKLVAITIPGMGTSGELQTVRFYYDTITLNTSGKFVGDITGPASGTIQALTHVYFPATKTQYKYEYNTNYGMIKNVTRYVGTAASSTSLTSTGTITSDGIFAASTEYDYPDGSTALTNVPKYTKRTDDWQGRTASSAQVTFYEEVSPDSGEAYHSRIKVREADFDTVTESIASAGGMLSETSIIKEYGPVNTATNQRPYSALMSMTKYSWSGARNLTKVEVTNDAGLIKVTQFDYDGYNNQTKIWECGYGAANATCSDSNALRRSETTYETGSGWTGKNIVGLPKTVATTVGGAAVAKTVLEYDHGGSDTTLTAYTDMNTATHDTYYNKYVEAWDEVICPDGEPYEQSAIPGGCVTVHHDGYDASSAFRGNVTKVTRFSDATLTSDTNADVSDSDYDMAGNLVSATLSCCNVKTINYGATFGVTGYAYPVKQTKGSTPDLETEATYDYNTGLVTATLNENDQTTGYEYESDTLRPKKTNYPNGGYVQTEYSDKLITSVNDLLPGFTRQTTKLDSTHTIQSYGYFNGRGDRVRSAAETSDGWLISAAEFDKLGRPIKSYNPFYGSTPTTAIPTGTKYSEVTAIDALGRTTGVTLQDNTSVSTYFSGTTSGDIPTNFNKTFVTVTDQAGKKRRQVFDALGRIVRVDEPDANGSLGAVDASLPNQQTVYEYDGNDNLSKVTQSDGTTTQERKFKYDSLSRLVAERQVEADATLELDGTHGTPSSSKWTKVLKYSTHGLLTDGYDARGVRTQLAYDGLNRISTVTYSGETGYQTPTVTYTYDQARSTFFNTGALTKVETAASGDAPATKTEFDYDLMGRVSKHRQWIGTQQYDLEYGYNLAGQLTSEKYPSGRIVTNSFDAKGRLSGISDQSRTYLNGLQFQGNGGSLSSMSFGNGTVQTFSINDRFQMTAQELKKGSDTLQKYNYGYGQIDGSGNLDTTKNNGQLGRVESWIGTAKQWTQKFSYDQIGRLAQSAEYRGDDSSLAYKQTFDFDRFGNMYRKAANNGTSGQANPLPYTPIEDSDISKSTNRLASNTTYDDAGNVVTDSKFRTMGFGYAANGRMVKATKTSVPDALSVYDAAGLRVAERVNDIWRFLIYDIGGKMVAEYGGLQSTDDGGVKYLLSDWQGSTRAVLGNTGVVNGRADYTAFGEEIGSGTGMRTATQGFGAPNAPRQKYGLTERDDGTGLDHTWFRKHENRAGRWTGADPYGGSMSLGDPQSFNRYSYVGGQPTNFVDPSGLQMVARRVCHQELRTAYVDGQFDSVFLVDVCRIEMVWEEEAGIGGGGAFIERLDKNALNTCLEMLYGLKADQFGVSVKLSRSGTLSTTAEETTYEANFSALEPGAKPVAELKTILVGKPHGKGEITLSQSNRDKYGDLDAMLLALGLALTDPAVDVGNYEFGGGFKVKRPGTPSALQDCYRRYAPRF